jgi:hypothetical protein
LHRDLTGRAGIGTVVARLAGLVRAHGPTRVLFIGGDSDQTSIGRELALATLLLEGIVLRNHAGIVSVSMVVGMAVVRSFDAGNECDKRCCAGGSDLELHGVERGFFGFLFAEIRSAKNE